MPLPTPPEGPAGSGTPEEVPPQHPQDDTYEPWGAPLDQNRLPADNLRLLELATASADASGTWTAVFDPVPLGTAWWGTISVPLLTPSQTANLLVGNKQIGVIPGSSPWGPIAALGGERVTLTATGLTPNKVYQGVWVGIIRDNLDVRELVAPQPIAVPLAGGGGGAVTWACDLAGSTDTCQTLVAIAGNPLALGSPLVGQVIEWNGTDLVFATPSAGGVTSVTAADASLTISPTTGAVLASRAALTGDVTAPAGSNTTTLAAIDGNPVTAPTPSSGQGLLWNGSAWVPTAVVNSFNTRTGAVVLTVTDIESTFTAKGQLFLGTGAGTGALLAIGSTGQVLQVAGGTATWATLAAIPGPATTVTGPDAFGAAAVVGTGTTYARNDHDHGLPANPVTLAAVEALFTAKGQLLLGTGAGAGTLLGIGSTGQVLTVSGGTAVWSPATGAVTSVTAGAGGSMVISPTTGAVVVERAALTGDATAALDSNALTVVALQGNPVNTGVPATGALLTWTGTIWGGQSYPQLGNFSIIDTNSSTTLIAGQIAAFFGSTAAQTMTIPVATGLSVIQGVLNEGTVPVTLATTGSDVINFLGNNGLATLSVAPGTGVLVVSDPGTPNTWHVCAYSPRGALLAVNNLSDVANKGTSRFNLNSPVITACAAVATTNVASLTGTPTIDGYALAATDHVLLVAQSTASQNGPWVLPAGGGAWTRPTDFPSGGVLAQGISSVVKFGTRYANTIWTLDTPTAGLTIDTTAQTWGGPLDVDPMTTAGDLIVGGTAGKPARLAVGAAGTVLQGGSTPAYGVLPGTILASQSYAPAGTTYTVAVTTIAALDTTNATLAFTVPANGIVDVSAYFTAQVTTGAAGHALFAALFNHTGGAVVGFNQNVLQLAAAALTTILAVAVKWHLTGLTPGAFQVDLAAGVSTGGAASIFAAGVNSKTVASNTVSPLFMQAIASI